MLGAFIGGDYPNESLSASMLIGGTLIVGANVLMQWGGRPICHRPDRFPEITRNQNSSAAWAEV